MVSEQVPSSFLPDEAKVQLIREAYDDPVFFLQTFLPHLYGGSPEELGNIPPMRWFHQGIVALLTKKTDFLWKHGQVSKIVREFTIIRGELGSDAGDYVVIGHMFQVFDRRNGAKLTIEQIKSVEHSYTPAQLEARFEIVLTLGKYTLLIVPRGFGKTTLAGLGVPIYFFCYELYKFFVYISETGMHANMQANNIRSELTNNSLLISIFGTFKPESRDELQKWSEQLFEANNGVAMAAKGRGAQIRGLNHKGRRPDMMIWDDLEDEESVSTPEQRYKVLNWAYKDAIPALPRLNKEATITALATVRAKLCLATTLAKDPLWSVVRFGIKDSEGEMLWPENMNKAEAEQAKRSYASKGLLQTYYLEYYNQYTTKELLEFKPEYFKYGIPPQEDIIAYAIYADPAIGENRTSDRAVIQVAAMLKNGGVYMAAEWSERGKPGMVKLTVDNYFKLCLLHRPRYHGFEANVYQKALGTNLKDAMPRHNYYFEPIPIVNIRSKNLRIGGVLLPRVAAGHVLWHPSFRDGETVQECLSWSGALKDQPDDGPDCASGVIALLEPLFPFAASSDPMQDNPEEYPDIELVMGQDWRSY